MYKDQELLSKLKIWFEQFSGTITAFSGGIDSALVLFLSRKYLGRERTIGVISNSESLKDKDYLLAIDFAKKNDILLETVYTKELSDPNYNSNPSNRCYFCKTHLYETLKKVKDKVPVFTILNGTNKDDFTDYRPGLQAANENGIRSPLAELGINKTEIRDLAKYFGIPFWNKPASPCLSSRIPYGKEVNAKKLQQIEKAEQILNDYGFYNVRVRHFENTCKIEVPLSEIDLLKKYSKVIFPRLIETGFKDCIIEEDGLVSGRLNRVLNLSNDES
jgi:uncharacterized protein